jgi:hypothetical protein
VSERRGLGHQDGVDVLPGDEQFDRLDQGAVRGVDEILALGDEQAELLAPAALVELSDELELLVLARGDQLD